MILYNTCIAYTCTLHMFYTCNIPKTHVYHRYSTMGHVIHILHIKGHSTLFQSKVIQGNSPSNNQYVPYKFKKVVEESALKFNTLWVCNNLKQPSLPYIYY